MVSAEARGFVLGGAVAAQTGAGFILARKPGKLPRETASVEYQLEYGVDALEVHADALPAGARVLVHDDLLATGGTAAALCELVEGAGAARGGLRVRDRAGLPGRPRAPGAARRAQPDLLRIGVASAAMPVITRSRTVPAAPERIWTAVADPEQLPRVVARRAAGGGRRRATPGPRCSALAEGARRCGPTTRCWSPTTRAGCAGATRWRSRPSSASSSPRSPSSSWSRPRRARPT